MLISVILPVYNSEKWIRQTLNSILWQSYENFECLILDDGSEDDTPRIISSFRDKRLKLIRFPKNAGYTIRLNQGIEAAKGHFLARIDADDVAKRERFATQLNYFQMNPSMDLYGTWTFKINDHDEIVGEHVCHTHHGVITSMLLSKTMLIQHPTVMMRRRALEGLGGYDTSFEPAEDFELWSRAILSGKRVGVIPHRLVFYRVHPSQVSAMRATAQREAGQRAVYNMMDGLTNGCLSAHNKYSAFAALTRNVDQAKTFDSSHEHPIVNSMCEIFTGLRDRVGEIAAQCFIYMIEESLYTLAINDRQGYWLYTFEKTLKELDILGRDRRLERLRHALAGRKGCIPQFG